MKRPGFETVLAVVLGLVSGSIMYVASGKYIFALENRRQAPAFTEVLVSGSPTKIAFPSLNQEIDVAPATASGKLWQIYSDKAAWLVSSPKIGQGNTVIYAHNSGELFGRLSKLRLGSEVLVQQDSLWYSFKVVDVKRLRSNQVNTLVNTSNRLTLYTCDGAFDQKRLVVSALPTN